MFDLHMLVELPAAEIPPYADKFFFTLQTRGIIPVLAHPERHPEIIKNPAILQAWIDKGVNTTIRCVYPLFCYVSKGQHIFGWCQFLVVFS
jgi:tyrosine-protein phosphatase YwqE